VTPHTLDFGEVKVGQKAVKSVIINTSSVSHLTWKIVSGDPLWLSITQSNETKGPDNLSEVIYDVTANTSKLHKGSYSVIYAIDAGGGKNQQVQINMQVISPSSKPTPAKLNVNPLALDFGTQNVGSQMTQLLTVGNSGQMDLNWMADRGNATWLTLDTSRGKIAPGGLPQVIRVSVNTTPLTASPYSAVINFTSNGGTASVDVKLNVIVTPTNNGPMVSSIGPASGPAGGGTTVTITGSGFTGATGVSFGATAATIVSVDSNSQITAISPAGSGTVHVTVTTPGGTSATSGADQFTYPTPPSVSSISPTSGPASGGTSVTITGSGFTCATSVSFGAAAVTNFTIVSDTQITVVSPTGNGMVDVIVTTPGGTSTTSAADQFIYIPTPTVTSIGPTSGIDTGGTTVIITGSNFNGATKVSFDGNAAKSFTIDSNTQITAVSPAGCYNCAVDVTVTTPGGTSATSSSDQFFYYPPIQ